MNVLQEILQNKFLNADYQRLVCERAMAFSEAEHQLLCEILNTFDFDVVQEQALVQAVVKQSQFNPNEHHIDDYDEDEDEDVTGVCPHCINPPMPPLRDYYEWRMKSKK